MKNICIIGVGNLGYRHYQALLKIDFDASLFLVDPNINAIESKINNTEFSNPRIKRLRISSSIDDLPNRIDLVIISTNSDVRAQVTKQLIESKNVLYILFEKVLFQKESDYHEVKDRLSEYGIAAWVNCPLRLYPYYQRIRRDIGNKTVRCVVSGWDIACNTIHFVDLVEWLSGEELDRVVTDSLSSSIVESKRKGFIEFTGELFCTFSGGSTLSMVFSPVSEKERNIEITTDNCQFKLNEISSKCKKIHESQVEEYMIMPVYQSELSNLVAKDIIFQQQCQLVTYNDSMRQHLILIAAFKKYVELLNDKYIIDGGVPVT